MVGKTVRALARDFVQADIGAHERMLTEWDAYNKSRERARARNNRTKVGG